MLSALQIGFKNFVLSVLDCKNCSLNPVKIQLLFACNNLLDRGLWTYVGKKGCHVRMQNLQYLSKLFRQSNICWAATKGGSHGEVRV